MSARDDYPGLYGVEADQALAELDRLRAELVGLRARLDSEEEACAIWSRRAFEAANERARWREDAERLAFLVEDMQLRCACTACQDRLSDALAAHRGLVDTGKDNPNMSPEEFARRMKAIATSDEDDAEVSHIDADALMCETLKALGYEDGVAVFEEMTKWYA